MITFLLIFLLIVHVAQWIVYLVMSIDDLLDDYGKNLTKKEFLYALCGILFYIRIIKKYKELP